MFESNVKKKELFFSTMHEISSASPCFTKSIPLETSTYSATKKEIIQLSNKDIKSFCCSFDNVFILKTNGDLINKNNSETLGADISFISAYGDILCAVPKSQDRVQVYQSPFSKRNIFDIELPCKIIAISNGRKYGIALTDDKKSFFLVNFVVNNYTLMCVSEDNIIKIAAGESHCIILTKGGKCYSWGKNIFGQLGQGCNYEFNSFEAIEAFDHLKVVDIACDDMGSYFLLNNGDLYISGKSSFSSQYITNPNWKGTTPIKLFLSNKIASIDCFSDRLFVSINKENKGRKNKFSPNHLKYWEYSQDEKCQRSGSFMKNMPMNNNDPIDKNENHAKESRKEVIKKRKVEKHYKNENRKSALPFKSFRSLTSDKPNDSLNGFSEIQKSYSLSNDTEIVINRKNEDMLNEKIEGLVKVIANLKESRHVIEKQLADVQESNKSLTSKNNYLNTRIALYEEEIRELKGNVPCDSIKKKSNISHEDNNLDLMIISDLPSLVEQQAKTITELEDQIIGQRNALLNLNRQLVEKQSFACKKHEDQITLLKESINNLKFQLISKGDDIVIQLQEKLNYYRKLLKDKSMDDITEYKMIINENRKLKYIINSNKALLHTHNLPVNNKSQFLNNQNENNILIFNEDIAILQKKLEMEIEKHASEIAQLKEEISILNRQYRDAKLASKRFEASYKEVIDENSALRAIINKLSNNNENIETSIISLINDVKFSKNVEEIAKQNVDLNNRAERLLETLERRDQLENNLKTEIVEISDKLKDYFLVHKELNAMKNCSDSDDIFSDDDDLITLQKKLIKITQENNDLLCENVPKVVLTKINELKIDNIKLKANLNYVSRENERNKDELRLLKLEIKDYRTLFSQKQTM
ncbi:hypothetical protein TRFO_03093 [Tritrichomonas foetus]|uniref:Uncharacterized protein n=1 Tax=Tritrichomonas foetus TaxID=1144522 RepID=A0A1J4KWH0_9EUKA|nr:hypothetical protein TRFO_03093 [Tritrichomonas foetus]|eukprot:OHT14092.1 hypothetical protein TRFO_03093 [Tritrichomonas foetus]